MSGIGGTGCCKDVQDITLGHRIRTFTKSVDNYESFGGWMMVVTDLPKGSEGVL